MRAIEKKVGILRRIFDAILNAMHESRRRQAEREIANFVALQGGRMTDDLERESPVNVGLEPTRMTGSREAARSRGRRSLKSLRALKLVVTDKDRPHPPWG
jgi:hypothetical protein